jgi:O-antigen/teichoic acid export membrane protein
VFFVLVLWLIAPLAAGYMGGGQLSGILRALSLVFFASPFVAIPLSVMIRHLEFKRIAVIQSLSMLISALISISMAWAGYGVWSLVAGHLAGSYLTAAFFLFEWRPGFPLDPIWSW